MADGFCSAFQVCLPEEVIFEGFDMSANGRGKLVPLPMPGKWASTGITLRLAAKAADS